MIPSLHNKMVQKAEEVLKAAEFATQEISDWQMIKQYITNRTTDIKLTERQQHKLDRYQFVYNQLVSGKHSEYEVATMLHKVHGVSLPQAYHDITCSKELFSTIFNINKIFEINLQLQINRKLQQKAEEMGDLKTVALFEKNRALLLKLLPEEESNPAEHFQGHTIEITFDPTLLGAPPVNMAELLKLINEKRGTKINVDMFETIQPDEDAEEAPLQ